MPSPAHWERLLSQLQRYGSFAAQCQPSSIQLSQKSPARPDSQQQQHQPQQQQTVQEPVLILTTSHLLVLEWSRLLICAISLQGVMCVKVCPSGCGCLTGAMVCHAAMRNGESDCAVCKGTDATQ